MLVEIIGTNTAIDTQEVLMKLTSLLFDVLFKRFNEVGGRITELSNLLLNESDYLKVVLDARKSHHRRNAMMPTTKTLLSAEQLLKKQRFSQQTTKSKKVGLLEASARQTPHQILPGFKRANSNSLPRLASSSRLSMSLQKDTSTMVSSDHFMGQAEANLESEFKRNRKDLTRLLGQMSTFNNKLLAPEEGLFNTKLHLKPIISGTYLAKHRRKLNNLVHARSSAPNFDLDATVRTSMSLKEMRAVPQTLVLDDLPPHGQGVPPSPSHRPPSVQKKLVSPKRSPSKKSPIKFFD